MTSRDELEELAKRLEESVKWLNRDGFLTSAELNANAAALIRSLLAQKPVATLETGDVYAGEYEEADVYLYDKQIDRQINDRLNGERRRVPLYAAPVPAVDIEAFKAEAMQLGQEWVRVAVQELGDKECKKARADLVAHLDKLGGK